MISSLKTYLETVRYASLTHPTHQNIHAARRHWHSVCLAIAVGAIIYFGLGSAESAIAAPDLTQLSDRALTRQVQRHQTQGDFAQAEADWSELLTRYPENPALWSNRGNIRVSLGAFEDAIADYNHAIALAPQEPDPYLNRGTVYEAQGQWHQAIADYNHVLELDPNDAAAYNNRGNAQMGLAQWSAAIADYEAAIAHQPDFAIARSNLALAQFEQGEVAQSLTQLRHLTRKYPVFADSRAALTAVLWSQGQSGEAESNWVAVQGLDRRYQDVEWVAQVRRWPPKMVAALERFLAMES